MSVRSERLDHTCVITLDRPEVRNAVDGPTAAELEAAVVAADVDDDVRVVVLTGAGGTFCAGADLKALASGDESLLPRLERSLDGPLGPTRRSPTKTGWFQVLPSIAGTSATSSYRSAVARTSTSSPRSETISSRSCFGSSSICPFP